jgi:hypothetical protein
MPLKILDEFRVLDIGTFGHVQISQQYYWKKRE